jgi:iron complex outermembrane receptor protein
VFEPAPTTSIGIDWYRIEVKNLIVQLDASTIFGNFAFWAPTNVVRRAPDANFPTLPGQVQFVIENLVNIGKQATTGIDVDFTHRTPNASWGRLTARLNGSYVMWWKQSTFESDAYPNFVGTRGPDGAIPRWRHYASLDWTRGPFGLTFAQNFQLGYNEDDFVTGGTRRVGDYTLYDLQGRWTGFRNVELRLGVRNLFDRAPPVSNQNNNFQVGYDPSYGDPRGRIFYGGVRVSFK